MASLLTLLTTGCMPTEKVLFEGTYNGMSYTVKAHETHNFNGSRTDWRLKLGKLPELPINITMRYATPVSLDGVVTTDWGPPYDDALYDTHELIYFGEKPAYSNIGDDYEDSVVAQHDYTVLYTPADLSRPDYQQYAAFMKAEWAKVDKALAFERTNYFPHLIGLVRASRQRFVRRFKGLVNGQPMVLRIDPDGYVNFDLDDGSAETNHVRHCVVQMPRKVIVLTDLYLWKDYGATKADIQQFRDGNVKSPEAYFVLED